MRHLIYRGLAVLAFVSAVSACKKPDAGTQKDPAADKAGAKGPVATKFIQVVERKEAPRLNVTGTLDPDERSEVASQTSGTALEVYVDVGSRVKKGDVLVLLDAREAAMRLDVANANAASQRARLGLKTGKFDADSVADVKMAREAADIAKTDFERTKMLYDQGAVSKSQYDQAKSNMERTDAAYVSSKNGAEQAFGSLIASQSQVGLSAKSVEDMKVRAPFDGAIEAKRIAPGEFASVGRIVVVLVKEDKLRFRFDVPEAQSALIDIGSKIELRVAAYPNKVFTGEVKRVGVSLKSQTRTLPVEAEIPNGDRLLKAGFFVRGDVQLAGEAKPTLIVPKDALLPVSGGSKIFVKDGDHVVERLVVTGLTRDDMVEVSGQIAAGDQVAIENVGALSDGVAID